MTPIKVDSAINLAKYPNKWDLGVRFPATPFKIIAKNGIKTQNRTCN